MSVIEWLVWVIAIGFAVAFAGSGYAMFQIGRDIRANRLRKDNQITCHGCGALSLLDETGHCVDCRIEKRRRMGR